jgi:hypothetical protein
VACTNLTIHRERLEGEADKTLLLGREVTTVGLYIIFLQNKGLKWLAELIAIDYRKTQTSKKIHISIWFI